MKIYQKRRVEFRQSISINDWKVKVYTLTYRNRFEANEILGKAVGKLVNWLEYTTKLDFEIYKIAFLMVHEGRDGVWSILNCWLGENMLRSITFRTSLSNPTEFEMLPEEGGMLCVWELEVVDFERKMWIEHILKKAETPDFAGYLNEKLSGEY